jgi:hypothetical protein
MSDIRPVTPEFATAPQLAPEDMARPPPAAIAW